MKLVTQTKEKYIPKWNGNRSLPATEQVAVHINYPTVEQKKGLKEIEYKTAKGSVVVNFDTDKILANHVIKIENLSEEIDGKEKAVKNGKELLASKNRVLEGLAEEITAEVIRADELPEEAEKNLE